MSARNAQKKLIPADLKEFRYRRAALEQQCVALAMMQENFEAWIADLKVKYGVRGKFDIDITTGQLIPRVEISDRLHKKKKRGRQIAGKKATG